MKLTKNPILLPIALGASLSMVYALPRAGSIAESAISMSLPETVGEWIFKPIPPSVDEIKTLHSDTKFSKAICLAPRPGEYDREGRQVADRIDLSVVLSGSDLNNSIHRPERCMPAQGHHITGSSVKPIDIPGHGEIEVKSLNSVQTLRDRTGEPIAEVKALTYYFFVGHDRIVHDHVKRTVVDMEDRLIKGVDQRWAYVSVSTWYGELPWMENEISQEEADKKIRRFIGGFSSKQVDWSKIK